MSYPAAVYEFSKAVEKAATTCTSYAETLIDPAKDPVARLAQRNAIYIEYMMTFMTIGIREARKLRIPETIVCQLIIECVEPTVKVVTDPFFELAVAEREALARQNRNSILSRAQALEQGWKNSEAMEELNRFLLLFAAVSKNILRLLKREGDWADKAVRDRMAGGAIEAWKAAFFARVLWPLAPTTQQQ